MHLVDIGPDPFNAGSLRYDPNALGDRAIDSLMKASGKAVVSEVFIRFLFRTGFRMPINPAIRNVGYFKFLV